MTIEDMKAGVSKIRNPVIARIFRELGLIEQWGSGVRRIFHEADELGLPEPEILEIGMRLRFVVRLSKNVQVAPYPRKNVIDKGAQSGAQSIEILKVLARDSMSSANLIENLGLNTKTGAFKRSINELLEQKLIEYTIPDKPSSRLQRYRITANGRDYLKILELNHG
jgi:ATP-dependent DNA helicase RecG